MAFSGRRRRRSCPVGLSAQRDKAGKSEAAPPQWQVVPWQSQGEHRRVVWDQCANVALVGVAEAAIGGTRGVNFHLLAYQVGATCSLLRSPEGGQAKVVGNAIDSEGSLATTGARNNTATCTHWKGKNQVA